MRLLHRTACRCGGRQAALQKGRKNRQPKHKAANPHVSYLWCSLKRARDGARPEHGRPSPIPHKMFVEKLVLNHLQTSWMGVRESYAAEQLLGCRLLKVTPGAKLLSGTVARALCQTLFLWPRPTTRGTVVSLCFAQSAEADHQGHRVRGSITLDHQGHV